MPMLAVTTPEPFSFRLRDELIRYGTATLHQAQGQVGAMDNGIKPIDPSMRLVGDRDGVVIVPTLDPKRVCSAADSRISHEDAFAMGSTKAGRPSR